MSAQYTDDYFLRRESSPLFSFELEALSAEIESMRVLEIGCGSGRLGDRLRQNGVASYVGSDVVAQPGGSPDLICDASSIPVGDSSFDVVVSQHVVEHLVDPRQFFAEAVRVLVGGGRLRFTTPNARYPTTAIFDDPTHVSLLDARAWRAMLATSGFMQITIRTFFPYLGHPRLLYQSVSVSRRVKTVGRLGAVIFAEARAPSPASSESR
jgi:2-polyprenyl-3-methyl-5-hydroxy-6-metoxy-1,4-benzoquinol methylase